MSNVWIAQLKCPSNHAILAAAGEYADEGEARVLLTELEAKFAEMVSAGLINRRCGLCLATDLHPTLNRTRFTTMMEATPYLIESERQQRETATYLRSANN